MSLGGIHSRRNPARVAARRVAEITAPPMGTPRTDAERLSFGSGAYRTRLPFELINNHIFIHAQVRAVAVSRALRGGDRVRLVERFDDLHLLGGDVREDRRDQRLAIGDVVGRRGAVAGHEQAALGGAAVDEARAGRR